MAFYLDGNSFLPWSSVVGFFQEKIQHGADRFSSRKKVFPLALLTALQSTHRWILKYRAKQK